ncbi:MAG: cyclodeaminase/cyclohydrolase family protein [Candidatus Omnitrophica bacterium]|nr:cyclodeaminase/cyclohydrolase family protein [Candidatus Omnitrophota bacterium]
MTKKFRDFTLNEYLEVLSRREPVPGGGSVAALSAALGCGLICMVTQYSLGKGKPQEIEEQLQDLLALALKYQARFLELVDLDSEAYLAVVRARKASAEEQEKANKIASDIPKEVCDLCAKAVELIPFLMKEGNKNLIHDVAIASEMLGAGLRSALVLANQ